MISQTIAAVLFLRGVEVLRNPDRLCKGKFDISSGFSTLGHEKWGSTALN
jgi:hypothetical protein